MSQFLSITLKFVAIHSLYMWFSSFVDLWSFNYPLYLDGRGSTIDRSHLHHQFHRCRLRRIRHRHLSGESDLWSLSGSPFHLLNWHEKTICHPQTDLWPIVADSLLSCWEKHWYFCISVSYIHQRTINEYGVIAPRIKKLDLWSLIPDHFQIIQSAHLLVLLCLLIALTCKRPSLLLPNMIFKVRQLIVYLLIILIISFNTNFSEDHLWTLGSQN